MSFSSIENFEEVPNDPTGKVSVLNFMHVITNNIFKSCFTSNNGSEQSTSSKKTKTVNNHSITMSFSHESSTRNMVSKQTSTISIEMKDEETQTPLNQIPPMNSLEEGGCCDRATSPIFNPVRSSASRFREMERITGHIIIHKFITRSDEDFQKLVELQFPNFSQSSDPLFSAGTETTEITTQKTIQNQKIPEVTKVCLQLENSDSQNQILTQVPDFSNDNISPSIVPERQINKDEEILLDNSEHEKNEARESMLREGLEAFEVSLLTESLNSQYPQVDYINKPFTNSSEDVVDRNNKSAIISSGLEDSNELDPEYKTEVRNENFQNICSAPRIPSNEKHSENKFIFEEPPSHKLPLISRISEEKFDEVQITSEQCTNGKSIKQGCVDPVVLGIVEEQENVKCQKVVLNLTEIGARSSSSIAESECYDGEKDDNTIDSNSSMSSMNSHCGGDNFIISKQVEQPTTKNIATQTDEKSFIRKLHTSVKDLPSSAESINSSTLNLLEVKLRVEKINLSVRVGGQKKKRNKTSILPSGSTNSSAVLGNMDEDEGDMNNISLDLLEVKGRSIRSHHQNRSQNQNVQEQQQQRKKVSTTPNTAAATRLQDVKKRNWNLDE